MQLPLSRVRQIINTDPECGMVTKEALLLISKATEFFVQDLAGVCAQIAKVQKRKTLQVSDIMTAASSMDKFHFIE